MLLLPRMLGRRSSDILRSTDVTVSKGPHIGSRLHEFQLLRLISTSSIATIAKRAVS
jgi:hypothetical protein